MKTFSITEAIKSGWATFKLNKGVLVSTSLVVLILFVLQSYQKKDFFRFDSQLLIWAVIFIVGIVIQSGYFKILLKISNGQQATFGEMFGYFNLFWKYFKLSVLMVIITIIPSIFGLVIVLLLSMSYLPIFLMPIIAVVGLVLYILFSLYVGLRLPFSFLILIDKEVGPIAALKESARITKDMKWNIFCLIFALGFIQLLGFVVLGVGVLVSFPVSMLAMIYVYRVLSKSVVLETPVTVIQNNPQSIV